MQTARQVDTPSDADQATGRPLILITLCLAVLIAQIDASVVNLAAQPIGRYFHARVATLQWVVDGFNLVYAALLLTGGLLADLYGRRRAFVSGAAIFTLASILSAFAPQVWMLILGRTFAGLGAALLIPASLAIIRVSWPDADQRAKVLGIWAAGNGVALAIGPTIGGFLIHAFGWRSVFGLTVPFGVAAVVLASIAVPESSDREGRHFDAGGQVLGILALGGIAIAAIESQREPMLTAFSLLIALTALAAFLRTEKRHGSAAMVPLDLFRLPTFHGAMVATAGMTFGMYGVLFLLPLYWQTTGALGSIGAGLALMPTAVAFILVSPFSGAMTIALGHRKVTSGGVAVIGVGVMVIAGSVPLSSIVVAEIGLILTGVGMGIATGQLMGAAVGAVPAKRSGSAAALINVARMIGATLGVAALGTIFDLIHPIKVGMEIATLAGGCVQLLGALWAWRFVR